MKLDRIEKRIMIGRKHAEYGIAHVEKLLPYEKLKEHRRYVEVGCGNEHVCILCKLDHFWINIGSF